MVVVGLWICAILALQASDGVEFGFVLCEEVVLYETPLDGLSDGGCRVSWREEYLVRMSNWELDSVVTLEVRFFMAACCGWRRLSEFDSVC